MRLRLLPLGVAIGLLAVPLLPAMSAEAQESSIPVVINEVESSGGVPGDWVELYNPSTESVDVSGFYLMDDNPREWQIPADTVIAAGEFLVLHEADFDFGLGGNDAVRLFGTDGTTLIDSYEWTSHAAVTYGRCPDGTGDFVDQLTATPGAANDCSESSAPLVVINEVESNGDPVGDWVELANPDPNNSVDISGWSMLDDDPTHIPIVFPEGTVIESGGYFTFYTDLEDDGFGLGSNDSVIIMDAAGAVVDAYSWNGHAATTYGRCPDMTGPFVETGAPTRGTINNCGGIEPPEPGEPWPGSNEVIDAIAPGLIGGDLSGLDFSSDDPALLYGVNNGTGELYEFVGDGPWTINRQWTLRYSDGTGTPDAEGVSAAPGGVIYVATERNNDASSTSRPSVLRFELGAPGELAATHEWNLAEIIGTVGANGGLEAVEWISDEDAVALGLTDSTGAGYTPADFGPHGGGVFVVGVEGTGNLHVLVLEDDGSVTQLQQHASGFQGVMALDFDTDSQLLWVVCDEVCGGQSATWSVVDGQFAALVVHERPIGLGNFANEGFALGACRTDQTKIVVWGDDAETDGISLRQGTLGCTLHEEPTDPPITPAPTEPTPTDPVTPGTPAESPTPVAPVAPEPGGSDRPGKLPATGAPIAIGALAAGAAAIAAGGTILARRR